MNDWNTTQWIVFFVPGMLAALGVVIWLFMRKTIRTRLRVQKVLRADTDINEWLVVFNWSRKVLYWPMIVTSIVAAVLTSTTDYDRAIGGIWLGVFILNFLIDEFELSVKVLTIVVLAVVTLLLWLAFLDWIDSLGGFFRQFGVLIDWRGYVILAGLFSAAVVFSYVRGLFYYVAVTPNYLNIQMGPTETGEQVAREEYSTRVDTGDFLERLMGFGRLVITFADQRRQPIVLLVSGIGRKASMLESLRSKLAIDRHQPAQEGFGPQILNDRHD